MLAIKGYGVLTIGKKDIPFENKVNTNFLMAPMNLIDLQGMGGGAYESHGLMENPCTSFQILSDSYDQNFQKIYNRLAFVGMSSFTAAVQKPTRVVLRGGGQFHTTGIARSAGFNVVTGEGAVGGVLPYVNVPRRRARVRVSGIASLPFADNWVYHPTLKALYRYAQDSAEIWKLDFDIDTGEFGTSAVRITNQFTPTANSSYRFILTDGVSKLFRLKDNSRNVLLVFDLNTEQLTEVPLSTTLSIFTGDGDKFYNEATGCLNMDGGNSGFGYCYEVNPVTGAVNEIPKSGGRVASFSSVYVCRSDHMLEQKYVRRPLEETNLAYSYNPSTGGSTGYFTEYLNKTYRFPDDNGWVIRGTFDSATTPGTCQLYMAKEPDMAYSLIAIPPTEVDVDTPFSIEYTLEVMGG